MDTHEEFQKESKLHMFVEVEVDGLRQSFRKALSLDRQNVDWRPLLIVSVFSNHVPYDFDDGPSLARSGLTFYDIVFVGEFRTKHLAYFFFELWTNEVGDLEVVFFKWGKYPTLLVGHFHVPETRGVFVED